MMQLISGFIWLLLFLFVGWIINKVMKKPAVNGAELYFWLFLAQIVFAAIMLYRPAPGVVKVVDPNYAFGSILGAYFLPMLIAAGLAWGFRKKKKQFVKSQQKDSN